MDLYGVRVFVDDFVLARRFYGDTLGLAEAWSMDNAKAVGFRVGPAQLIVEEAGPGHAHQMDVARFVGVSLQVADITAAHETLKAKGVDFLQAPKTEPWGASLAHFRDPAGNILTLLG